MSTVWSKRSLRHLEALRQYIERSNPKAARKIAATLVNAVERLRMYPASGRPGRILGTRELVDTGTPYVIPYRVLPDRVEIIAVFHGRQRWNT